MPKTTRTIKVETMEAWFNSLDNETLESIDLPPTRPEFRF